VRIVIDIDSSGATPSATVSTEGQSVGGTISGATGSTTGADLNAGEAPFETAPSFGEEDGGSAAHLPRAEPTPSVGNLGDEGLGVPSAAGGAFNAGAAPPEPLSGLPRSGEGSSVAGAPPPPHGDVFNGRPGERS
jgi:hypothetical protein